MGKVGLDYRRGMVNVGMAITIPDGMVHEEVL